MLLVLFLVVVYLLSAFQAAHHHLEETVQQRNHALQAEIAERSASKSPKSSRGIVVAGTMAAAQVAMRSAMRLSSIILINKEINQDPPKSVGIRRTRSIGPSRKCVPRSGASRT